MILIDNIIVILGYTGFYLVVMLIKLVVVPRDRTLSGITEYRDTPFLSLPNKARIACRSTVLYVNNHVFCVSAVIESNVKTGYRLPGSKNYYNNYRIPIKLNKSIINISRQSFCVSILPLALIRNRPH